MSPTYAPTFKELPSAISPKFILPLVPRIKSIFDNNSYVLVNGKWKIPP